MDGQLVGQAEFPVTTPIIFNPGGLTCGANPGSPVTPDYQSPFRFTGTLHSVTVDLSGDLITDTESECGWPWPGNNRAGELLAACYRESS